MSNYKLPKVEELLKSGVHYGHQVRRWNPKMEQYIYSAKNNIHIIDLEDTEKGLKASAEFLHNVAKDGGQIIFVGTKKQSRDAIKNHAEACGALYITERWLGGTITNFKVLKKNIDKLLNHLKNKESGEYNKYTKKERLLIDREIEKLQKNVGGLTALRGVPQAVFLIDAKREKTAIREANKSNVPVVALVDTNSDPTGISYVIPGNDDAMKSIEVIVKALAEAVEAGYKEFEKVKADAAEKIRKDAEAALAEPEIIVDEEKVEELISDLNVPLDPEEDTVKAK